MEITSTKGYLIYGLIDPFTNQLRYIGKSTVGFKRPKSHFLPYKLKDRTHKVKWIKSILNKKIKPKIIIIQQFKEPEILYQAEQFWIKYFREMGCPLTNLTDDGPGSLGLKHKKETIEKLRKAQIGRRPTFTGPHTKATKDEISKSKMGMSYNKGISKTENTKIKISRKLGGRPLKDQFGNIYQTQKEAARKLKTNQFFIWCVLNKRCKHVKGIKLEYLQGEG